MNICKRCSNHAPTTCENDLCADHCLGCEVHRNVKRKTPLIKEKTVTRKKYNIFESEDDDLAKAIRLSLKFNNEDQELLQKALNDSILEEERSMITKVHNIKMVFPNILESRIRKALQDCKGNEDGAIESLLISGVTEDYLPTPSEPTLSDIIFEEEDECVICLDSFDCYFLSCGCCKVCITCHKKLMKKKCPICKKDVKIKANLNVNRKKIQ